MEISELKESYKKFGPIYPVLVDKKGKIIDGFHRKKAVKNWPTQMIDTDDEVKKQVIALVANITRREITDNEKTKRLDTIAELTGWKPKQIAEEVGMSENWVYKYLSQKYKEPEPTQLANSTRRVLSSDTDFDSDGDYEVPDDTMTEEENNSMEEIQERKMLLVFPPDVLGVLEREAKKAHIDVRHFVLKIVRKWANRRR